MGRLTAPRRRSSVCLLLLALVGSFALPATAGPEEQLEAIEAQQERAEDKLDAAEDEQSQLESDISGLDSTRDAIEERVDSLDGELATLDAEIAEVKEDLTDAQHELTALTEELDDIADRLRYRIGLLEARAVAAYKAGPAAAADGLLSAETFSDLIDRYEYYQTSLDADAELVEEVESLQADTRLKRDQLEEKEAEIADRKLALEEDRARVANIREERASALAEKESVISAKSVLLADAADREAQLEEWVDQLEADSDRIAALIAAQAQPDPPTGSGPSVDAPNPSAGGQFLWPASGSLTSPYGYRVHPIFGDTRLHSGIDIGAAYGSPVWAAEDGRVSYVGAMSGYGNVVILDHGGGIATTYNHLSGFSVSSGSSVSRGQQVGSVGCTGYCTGPHLHFEVRVNGTPVDPMPYLQ
ncbi:MAG: peptidoglycan DD-metalloendopeptidase family protein [Actinomycetota bacterium]|nr:peptidoglycan DD-metalloendopeptidase family protein [Actinomycetota bacterium]